MTCRDIESLILAERDGALTPTQCSILSDHVAACPACRELRTQLAASLEAYRDGVAGVRVPDVDEAWRDVQARLRSTTAKKTRRLAPVIWFGAPLAAAAAALAMVFVVGGSPFSRRSEVGTTPSEVSPTPLVRGSATAEAATTAALAYSPPPPPPPIYDPSIIAGADYVEAGNPAASTMVYIDKESGWLVVWISADDPDTRG